MRADGPKPILSDQAFQGPKLTGAQGIEFGTAVNAISDKDKTQLTESKADLGDARNFGLSKEVEAGNEYLSDSNFNNASGALDFGDIDDDNQFNV